MDNNTVFVRTSKGEDEAHSRTMHLPGDIRRALLMVDGNATYGEISKRAAPSLRSGLEAMFQELEKDGFITDKSRAASTPKMAVPPKMASPPRMSVPPKMAIPRKAQPANEGAGDLDFMSGFGASSSEAKEPVVFKEPDAEEKAMQDIEVEAMKFQAQQEAEALAHRAAQEAARISEEAEREKQRVAAIAKAEAEAKTRALIEAKARQEVEAARIRAEQEVAKAREEAEAALKARQKAEAMLIKSVKSKAEPRESSEGGKPEPSATATSRSTTATVLFLDVVGYTKQPVTKQIEIKKQFNQLVSASLKVAVDGERIILDTGDGAAIGFLQHPEDALEVAIRFRESVIANRHMDYPDLKVRMGIHLGPVNVTKDMNGRSNIVGDGINDAQRVMSFAGIDEIYISRPYYDFVSRLKDEYADMFRYRGMQEDKHGREHPVYEYAGAASAEKGASHQGWGLFEEVQPNPFAGLTGLTTPAENADKFSFDAFQIGAHEAPEGQQKTGELSPGGSARAGKPETFSFGAFDIRVPEPAADSAKREKVIPSPQSEGASRAPQFVGAQQGAPAENRLGREEEDNRAEQERVAALEAKKQADAEAAARAEAEQRAAQAAEAEIGRAAKKVKKADAPPAAKPVPVVRPKRKPFSLGRLMGLFFKLGIFLLVLTVAALFVVPYALPTRDYIPGIEKLLSAKLRQPVHIGHLSVRILPMPRLQLGGIDVGGEKQLQAAQAHVNFSLTGLLTDAKPIDSIELDAVKVSGADLPGVSRWIQQIAADSQYPVARILIKQGALEADALKFDSVEGALEFRNGEFNRANLRSGDGKYMLDITPGLGSRMKIAITLRNSALPLLPNWQFDDLTANGELSNSGLSVSEFHGRTLGGILQGKADINWRSAWGVQGTITAKTISMQRLGKLLEGNIDGSARFRMSAADLAGLADSVVTEGTFMARNGTIGGMDIVTTARTRSREHMPGGRTRFDELNGNVAYANNKLHIGQARITSTMLTAVAELDIEKQQVSGSMTTRLALEDGGKAVDLQIGGTIDSPTLRFAP